MLADYIKTDGNFKAFNVNMQNNIRTLHINSDIIGPGKDVLFGRDGESLPARKCPEQRPLLFIPFDTLEDVEAFEKKHRCSFRRCGNCFPESMRVFIA